MLLLQAYWMMLKNSYTQGGANSMTLAPGHMKSQLQLLLASKAIFLKNYLAVSTCIAQNSATHPGPFLSIVPLNLKSCESKDPKR